MPSSERDSKGGADRLAALLLRPEPRVLPVFPIANVVLFPLVSLPLYIFEERYKTMMADVLAQDRALSIALAEEDDGEAGPRDVCCVGVVTDVEELDDGEMNIVVTGSHRARIVERVERRPYLVARVEPLEEQGANLPSLRSQAEELKRLAIRWIFVQDSERATELIQRISLIDRPGFLADFLVFHLFEDVTLKQEILETTDVPHRVARLRSLLVAALEQQKTEKK